MSNNYLGARNVGATDNYEGDVRRLMIYDGTGGAKTVAGAYMLYANATDLQYDNDGTVSGAAFVTPSPDSPAIQGDEMPIFSRWSEYGMVPQQADSGFDNSPNFQALCDDWHVAHHDFIYLPGRRFRFDDTVEVCGTSTSFTGGAIVGAGCGPYIDNMNSLLLGPVTTLKWYGTTGTYEPLIKSRQAHGTFEKFAIRSAPVGILIDETAGLGTGRARFQDVLFDACDIGIQLALEEADTNCDVCNFDGLYFDACVESGMQLNGAQAMAHTVTNLHVRDTPVVFDVVAGGNIFVRGGFVGQNVDVVLDLGSGAGLGSNNCQFALCDLKFDTSSQAATKLVDMASGKTGQLVCDRLIWARDTMTDIGHVMGPFGWIMRDCYNMQANTMSWTESSGTPRIHLDGCAIDSANAVDVLNEAASTGDCVFSATNCYRYSTGAAIADVAAGTVAGLL